MAKYGQTWWGGEWLKKDLANLTVASGEKWIGELSNSELRKIFSL